MVTQTILAEPELMAQGIFGNCLQAAVASLFSKPIDAVPNFATFNCWACALELWARGNGLTFRGQRGEAPPGRCIAYGRSPRGYGHVCVADNGVIVWDPHPSRAGLEHISGWWWFEACDHVGKCYVCREEYPPYPKAEPHAIVLG